MPLRYAAIYVVPLLAIAGLLLGGVWTAVTPLFVFGLIPTLELFVRGKHVNLSADAEAPLKKSTVVHDAFLYGALPAQLGVVILLLVQVSSGALVGWEIAAATFSVGLCCGGVGINVAHELGHRSRRLDQRISQALLLTTLYMHFFIEHNRGHHARVATDEDPASSRRGEMVFTFWVRSMVMGWISAWKMEWALQERRGRRPWGLRNQMVQFHLIQAATIGAIGLTFGPLALGCFFGAALTGILILETVNYVEHYGLRREKGANGRYEAVQPAHSWNADHPIGRAMLFELTRHSDHHANPKRPYPVLRSFEHAPQLPTGYPGMMVLSVMPPLFFAVMDRQLDRWEREVSGAAVAA